MSKQTPATSKTVPDNAPPANPPAGPTAPAPAGPAGKVRYWDSPAGLAKREEMRKAGLAGKGFGGKQQSFAKGGAGNSVKAPSAPAEPSTAKAPPMKKAKTPKAPKVPKIDTSEWFDHIGTFEKGKPSLLRSFFGTGKKA